ncbi:MAG: septum site-determining protein MinC [Legionellales bacterium RIFCSPHIGHO2_12_FULL_35_11]|nr:MAG: septum site-determining protein MinC [Legionellales bacterium RIFCSPHIGHO2_12_FULL_35_11]
MSEEMVKKQVFKLKGRLYTLTVVHLLNSSPELFAEQIVRAVKSAPRLFNNTPVIIDCSSIGDENVDLAAFCSTLRQHSMLPIGVQGGPPTVAVMAAQEGLPVLYASSSQDKSLLEIDIEDEVIDEATETIRTTLLTTPVRSGQQIASREGDLIITASVSNGAELLADGNIHVYGALRGKALAGIRGDKHARIFCQSLDAQLVAISGIYCLSDSMPKVDKPCQIFLKNDKIQVEEL